MTPWDKAYASLRRESQLNTQEPDGHAAADLALYIVAVIALAVVVIF
jgi:hypothetical protein